MLSPRIELHRGRVFDQPKCTTSDIYRRVPARDDKQEYDILGLCKAAITFSYATVIFSKDSDNLKGVENAEMVKPRNSISFTGPTSFEKLT